MQRTPENLETILETHGNMLYRLCLIMLKNESDAEDAIQETLIKYIQKAPVFQSPDHEKAWLIRVATNQCRDQLRYQQRHPQVHEETLNTLTQETEDSGILEALTTLPEKFRLVLTLYYIEEYTTAQIAAIIGKTPSAVKMRLHKGRKLLEDVYRKEYL